VSNDKGMFARPLRRQLLQPLGSMTIKSPTRHETSGVSKLRPAAAVDCVAVMPSLTKMRADRKARPVTTV
jgi:hypothetical protein